MAFDPFDSTAKSFVAGEIEKLPRSQLQPDLILWRIVDSLVKEKIEIPGYYPLAELILAAANIRKAELCAIIERALTARTREALDELLVQVSAGEDEPVPAKTAAYKLTLLKKLSQSTKPSKIRETITDLLVVQGLYRDFLPILCALDLNHEGIRYYAHSVIKSEIFQVTRRSSEDRYLHLIALITLGSELDAALDDPRWNCLGLTDDVIPNPHRRSALPRMQRFVQIDTYSGIPSATP
jgi:hypothetical protein